MSTPLLFALLALTTATPLHPHHLQTATLHAVTPNATRLYLFLNEHAYSVPMEESINNIGGFINLDRQSYHGTWATLPWMAKLTTTSVAADSVNIVHSASANDYLIAEYADRVLLIDHLGTSEPVERTNITSAVTILGNGISDHSYSIWSEPVTGRTLFHRKVAEVDHDEVTFRLPFTDNFRIHQAHPLVHIYFAITSPSSVTFYKANTPNLPPSTSLVMLTPPLFGFLHNSMVHIWSIRTRSVLLFPDPGQIYRDLEADVDAEVTHATFTLRRIPFAKYFVGGGGGGTSGNGTQMTTEQVEEGSSKVWILGILICVVGGLLVLVGGYNVVRCARSMPRGKSKKLKRAGSTQSSTSSKTRPISATLTGRLHHSQTTTTLSSRASGIKSAKSITNATIFTIKTTVVSPSKAMSLASRIGKVKGKDKKKAASPCPLVKQMNSSPKR